MELKIPSKSDSFFYKYPMQNILRNLSMNLSQTPFDIVNVGIHVYDNFTIQENIQFNFSKPNSTKSISLRSKSTRNLNIRDNSYTNLLKSFKLVLEKVENDTQSTMANVEFNLLDELNKSKSRHRLTPIYEKRKKKNNQEAKKSKQVLEEVYNMKYKKSNKSLRSANKESPSKKAQIKNLRISSLTPGRYF